jgi:DNA-directed RNA polymerase specialized sigma24 family protein
MFKRILESSVLQKRERQLLDRHLSEVREIADMLITRIEEKIEMFRQLEGRVDEKTLRLEALLARSEAKRVPLTDQSRPSEIVTLHRRGLKIDEIAAILDIPSGEVELILNLHTTKS